MSKVTHTPGPWKFSTETHFSGGAPYSESVYVTMGGNTLTVGCHTGAPYQETLEANAKLIAAAPKLLEALQSLINVPRGREHDTLRFIAEAKAIAAIEKATA